MRRDSGAAALDFQVKRDDLHSFRVAEAAPPELQSGQALLAVDAFGFSSSNITYALRTITDFTAQATREAIG